ncbi:MAG: serine/threonine protein kinase [Myxococcota bacterium]|nr:serine/threonine protein kinase [Myxococcota bacterium]
MPDLDDSFFRLSPDRVLQAVEAAGFEPTGHCTALNALENRVYDLRVEDGSHVVAKFYRPARWSREAILDEHRMLFALRDAEIPVCAPLVLAEGETLHQVEGIFYAVWPRTGGRAPDEFSHAEIAVLGRMLARIHNVGAAIEMPHRPVLTPEAFPLAALAALEEGAFLPPSCARLYRECVEEVVEVYRARSGGVPVHPIHGDCHAGNLLRGDDGWFFLDFDDMVVGPAVQDVWMLLPGRDGIASRQRDLLVSAYREFRDFDERSLALVEPLRAFRFVWYAGWIARRWEDPAFPDAFPHFGSEDYWETETRDLAEQVERIQRGGEGVSEGGEQASNVEGPDLTNDDFFWDL